MSDAEAVAPTMAMNAVSRRFARTDAFFRNITRFAAFAVFGVLIGVIVSLYLGALPSIIKFGIGFLWTNAWNPVKENFGALAQICATAMLLAAMREMNFVIVTALTKTEPVHVALFGLVVLGEHLTAGLAAAILLATAGVLIMSRPNATPSTIAATRRMSTPSGKCNLGCASASPDL